MKDFSEMLSEMVVHQRGPEVVLEARKAIPYDPVEAGRMAGGSTDTSRASMKEMMISLKNLRKLVAQQMQEMNDDLVPLFEEVKRKLGVVHTQFKGLMHMTREQRTHIADITQQANVRIKEL